MEPTLDVDTHNDESYAAPHLNRKPRHRKSSLIDRWIQDQQGQQTTPDVDVFSANEGQDNPLPAPGSLCHPYLAYPHLSRSSLPLNPVDEREADTRHRHDPGLTGDTSSESFFPRPLLPYSVPSSPLRLPPQTVFVHKPSSLRSFPIPFRPSTPSTAKMHREAQQTTSRHSLFKLLSRTGGYTSLSPAHTRSTSLDLLSHPTNTATSELPSQLPWKWRPSVLNHFGSLRSKDFCPPMDVFKPDGKPPATDSRQSTSSSYTSEDSARQLSFTTSIQSRRSSTSKVFKFGDGSASSPSLWSQTTSVSMSCHEHTHSAHMASTTRIPGSSQRSTVRVDVDIDSDGEDLHKTPLTSDFDPTMPYVAYSSQNSQRLSLSLLGNAARNRKKKRLVLKGVQFHDNKKFEAVKQWCERFGEVSQITRMPNGDLHVNFARAEVADTVCRLRANVHITGVGSVYLSWYTGNKLR